MWLGREISSMCAACAVDGISEDEAHPPIPWVVLTQSMP